MAFTDFLPAIGQTAASLVSGVSNLILAGKQREYDRRMIAEQNKYNSPVEQVKRLRAAGINPAIALTNGSISSGDQSQTAGGQTAPTVDFSPIGQGVRNSVELYQQRLLNEANIDKLKEETHNQSIKNRFEAVNQYVEINKKISEAKRNDADTSYLEMQKKSLEEEIKWIDQKNSSMIAKNKAETDQAVANAAYTRTLTSAQEIMNKYLPSMQKAQLDNLRASTKQMLAAAAEHGAGAALKYAQKFLTDLQREGVKIDNQEKPRLAKALADAAEQQAEKVKAEAGIAKHQDTHGTFWTHFFGSATDENMEDYNSTFNE